MRFLNPLLINPSDFYSQVNSLHDYASQDINQLKNFNTVWALLWSLLTDAALAANAFAQSYISRMGFAFVINNELTQINFPYNGQTWNIDPGLVVCCDPEVASLLLDFARQNNLSVALTTDADFYANGNSGAGLSPIIFSC